MIEINQVEFLVVSLIYYCFYDALTYGEVIAISPLKENWEFVVKFTHLSLGQSPIMIVEFRQCATCYTT